MQENSEDNIENRLVFQKPEFVKNEIRKTFKRKDPEFE